MDSTSHTVTVWQSGKLAPHVVPPRFEFELAFGREQWLGAGLAVLALVVFALYVAVLEHDVNGARLTTVSQVTAPH